MSESVRFTKAGLRWYEWQSETRTYEEQAIKQDEILTYLRRSCQIDRDVTLGDFFRAVSEFPALVKFVSQYSWCWAIEDFHAEALLPRLERKDEEQLEALEISQHFEIEDPNPKYPSIETIQMTTDFHGVGKPSSEHGSWSVSLSPMNELAHLPIRLRDRAKLLRNMTEPVGDWPCTFTLLDVLDAVYDDISFHGGPKQREDFGSELRARVAEVEAGTATLIPHDEVFGVDKIQ